MPLEFADENAKVCEEIADSMLKAAFKHERTSGFEIHIENTYIDNIIFAYTKAELDKSETVSRLKEYKKDFIITLKDLFGNLDA